MYILIYIYHPAVLCHRNSAKSSTSITLPFLCHLLFWHHKAVDWTRSRCRRCASRCISARISGSPLCTFSLTPLSLSRLFPFFFFSFVSFCLLSLSNGGFYKGQIVSETVLSCIKLFLRAWVFTAARSFALLLGQRFPKVRLNPVVLLEFLLRVVIPLRPENDMDFQVR